MLNRRHIRIKVMQSIYAFKSDKTDDESSREKFLLNSLDSMYDLYLSIFALLTEIYEKSIAYNQNLKKTISTNSAVSRNESKIAYNEIFKRIASNAQLQGIIAKRKLNFWDLDFEYVDILHKDIRSSAIYEAYAKLDAPSFEEDKFFVLDIYSQIIAPNDKLYNYFEDKSLTWVDDIPIVNTVIVKLLRKLKPSSPNGFLLPDLYRDDQDKSFAVDLLRKTRLYNSKFAEEIAARTKNWDADRLADIDGVLLKMAICELQLFPSIPHKVTINEYVEIAKEYSTPKSSTFINGILDRLVRDYSTQNIYPKSGRGLL